MPLAASLNINYLWAALLIEELVRNGVEYFCISPGSRSAPLTMAAAAHPKSITFVHFDERGTGFHALGYISAAKRPCAVITTSGTAVANLFPALIETSKKKLPLIVLTADRPPELRFTGAHQTIDQVKIFNDYVRWQVDLPCPTTDIAPEFILTTMDQAVAQAKGNPAGPVHINCMFREPLAPTATKTNFKTYLKTISSWVKKTTVYTDYHLPVKTLNSTAINAVLVEINKIKKGIIVVGKLSSNKERASVLKVAKKLGWPVLPDISSGLRLGSSHENLIPYFDQILLSKKFIQQNKPEGILHLGGRITSKRWYEYIEKTRPNEYIMVLNHPLRNDPLHNISTRVECPVGYFFENINKKITARKKSSFLSAWQKANQQVEERIKQRFDKDGPLTESAVARLITQTTPNNTGLFLSNSMAIREVFIYGHPGKKLLEIGANRGASGIDGIMATAAGFKTGLNKPVTLLIGDLAFLHDLNSLAMLKQLKYPLVIIILNNNGGKIFSHLPIAQKNPHFEYYFKTPHHLTFHNAAEMFDLNYARPETKKEFIQTYTIALKSNVSTIIEIKNERESS